MVDEVFGFAWNVTTSKIMVEGRTSMCETNSATQANDRSHADDTF